MRKNFFLMLSLIVIIYSSVTVVHAAVTLFDLDYTGKEPAPGTQPLIDGDTRSVISVNPLSTWKVLFLFKEKTDQTSYRIRVYTSWAQNEVIARSDNGGQIADDVAQNTGGFRWGWGSYTVPGPGIYYIRVCYVEGGGTPTYLLNSVLEGRIEVSKYVSNATISSLQSNVALGVPNRFGFELNPPREEKNMKIKYSGPGGITIIREVSTQPDGTYTDSFTPDVLGSWNVQAEISENLAYLKTNEEYHFTVINNVGGLKVTVTDNAGAPISGVSVSSTSQPSGQANLSGTTGTFGTIQFSEIKPGSYTIQIAKSGMNTATLTGLVEAGITTEKTTKITMIPITGDIKVIVKDNLGAPINAASVSSTSQPSGQVALTGVTGVDGSIQFNGVKPGSYTIQALKTGYVTATSTATPIAGSIFPVNITLQIKILKGSLKVLVKDDKGTIQSGVTISSTTQPAGQPSLNAVTDSQGSAIFSSIEPGSYTVLAVKTGYDSNTAVFSITADKQTETTIIIKQTPIIELPPPSSGIPGYPYESLILGLAVIISILVLSKKNLD